MNQKSKFIVGSLIIAGVVVWLGVSGVQESKTYYVTLPELRALDQEAFEKRLRVAGDVVPGSIRRQGREVHFQLHQGEERLNVVYVGSEPLPDTFQDNAQAIVTGRLEGGDLFRAQQVQAKCASKYEALPPGAEAPSAGGRP